MSYILDALKKLEKERRRGRIPGISEQDSVVYHSQRRLAWPYILLAVLFLNAALLIWWFLPKQSKDNVTPAMIQDVKGPEIKESGNVVSSGAKEPSSVSLPPAKDAVSDKSVQPVRNLQHEEARKTTGLMNSEPKAENEKQKMTEALPQEKKPEVVAEPLPEKKLYKLSELPPAVRDSLPGFSITAFLYSDSPSGRMARINERMMREGQELEPGIRIEEIVTDGVILSYKKFRFFVSLK